MMGAGIVLTGALALAVVGLYGVYVWGKSWAAVLKEHIGQSKSGRPYPVAPERPVSGVPDKRPHLAEPKQQAATAGVPRSDEGMSGSANLEGYSMEELMQWLEEVNRAAERELEEQLIREITAGESIRA
jgi:hypothetical protein